MPIIFSILLETSLDTEGQFLSRTESSESKSIGESSPQNVFLNVVTVSCKLFA